jgi:CRP/FNR family transcriptional regulator
LKTSRPYCTDATWIGRADCKNCDVRGIVLFSELGEIDLSGILPPIDNLLLPAQSVLYREGDAGDNVFTIRRGLVRLVHYAANGTRRIVRLLKAGSVCGLEVLVTSHYHQTAEAVSDTDICRIPAGVLSQIGSQNPALHRALMERWQNSLDDADAVITQLSTGSAQARAARYFLQVCSDDPRTKCHDLSRSDIAALLGLTVETVSRVFAEFKRSGWLVENPRYFTIDAVQLERIAAD